MKQRLISWQEYGELINQMIEKIKRDIPDPKKEFDGVFGIENGGLPVALAVHHAFGIEMRRTASPKTLVVDDISDTGETLLKRGLEKNKIAALFSTPWTKVKPNWHSAMKNDKNEWLVFPYENPESESAQSRDFHS